MGYFVLVKPVSCRIIVDKGKLKLGGGNLETGAGKESLGDKVSHVVDACIPLCDKVVHVLLNKGLNGTLVEDGLFIVLAKVLPLVFTNVDRVEGDNNVNVFNFREEQALIQVNQFLPG